MGKTRRRIRTGGDARQGAQGCVIIPSLVTSADGTRDMKYVTKIFFLEKEFNDEKSQNDSILSKIDPGGKFTAAAYTETPIDVTKMTPQEQAVCSGLKGKDVSKLKFLNYKYIGSSLDDIIHGGSVSVADSKKILVALSALLPKIIEMNVNGFFHNDVHGGNIMYNKTDEHAYLIDFGMMTSSAKSPLEFLRPTSSKPGDKYSELKDLFEFLTVVRIFAVEVSSQSGFPRIHADILEKYARSISPFLSKILNTSSVEEARDVILRFFIQFVNSYQELKGGRKKGRKTLRRRSH